MSKKHVICALFLLAVGAAAQAGTYNVTSVADPGDGICDASCTLRDAVIAANANPGADTIDFSAIVQPAGPVTISLASGLPLITETLMMDASIAENRALPSAPTRRPGIELDLTFAAPISGPNYDFYPDGINLSGPGASGSEIRGFIINGLNGSSHGQCLLADENPDPASTPANPFPRQGYCGVAISLFAANEVVIAGNYLNADADGMAPDGTGTAAVEIFDGSDNVIGGSDANDRNIVLAVLQGGGFPEILATAIRPWLFGWSQPAFGAPKKANGNRIEGNYIGAAADGTPLNPITRGVWMSMWNAEDDSVYGGGQLGWGVQCDDQAFDPCEMVGNVVTGNVFNNAGGPSSVAIFGPLELTEVSGNLIFNTTGPFPVGEPYGRVEVFGIADISALGVGNPEPYFPSNVIIADNQIGVDDSGNPTGWSVYGVGIGEGFDVLIVDNTITGALFEGVFVGSPFSEADPQNVTVSRNALFGNAIGNAFFGETGILGLDLRSDSVTANDAKDADDGPNGLQNFPVLNWAQFKQGQLRVHGHLESERGEQYRIEFFASTAVNESGHGEGALYLGAIDVATNGGGNAVIDTGDVLDSNLAAVGDFVTATATRLCTPDPAEGECLFGTAATSEFSLAVEVTK